MRYIALGAVLFLFIVACSDEYDLPSFPDEPVGQATGVITGTGVKVVPSETLPGSQITYRLTPGDGRIYAVYRYIYFDDNKLQAKVSNSFPKKTNTYTAIVGSHKSVEGTFTVPADAKPGKHNVSVTAYKLVNGAWDLEKYYYFQKTVFVKGENACSNVGTTRCNQGRQEKCVYDSSTRANKWVLDKECGESGCDSGKGKCFSCKQGKSWCSGGDVKLCEDGYKIKTTDCGNKGCDASNGTARCNECKEGTSSCTDDWTGVMNCVNGLYHTVECTGTNPFCRNNKCLDVGKSCTTGAKQCVNDENPRMFKCINSRWKEYKQCPYGCEKLSTGYQCFSLCEPGTLRCTDGNLEKCKSSGQAWTVVSKASCKSETVLNSCAGDPPAMKDTTCSFVCSGGKCIDQPSST